MKRGTSGITLILTLAICYGSALLTMLISSRGMQSYWYNAMKPSIALSPSHVLYVWIVLLLLITFALCISWKKAGKEQTLLGIAWITSLLLGFLWTIFFFYMQSPSLALIAGVALATSVSWIMGLYYRIDKKSCILLVPYLVWIIYSIILTSTFIH